MGNFIMALTKRSIPDHGGTYHHGTIYVPSRDNQWSKTIGNQSDKEYEWIYSCGKSARIRIPSLKRSKRCWRNFYHLFPFIYEEAKKDDKWTFNGFKLKPV